MADNNPNNIPVAMNIPEQMVISASPTPRETAVKFGAISAVTAAILGAGLGLIPGVGKLFGRGQRGDQWLSRTFKGAAAGASFGSVIGGAAGYALGAQNERLQQAGTIIANQQEAINELAPYKPYAEKLVTEMAKKDLKEKLGAGPKSWANEEIEAKKKSEQQENDKKAARSGPGA